VKTSFCQAGRLVQAIMAKVGRRPAGDGVAFAATEGYIEIYFQDSRWKQLGQ
jgi:hypothetical protein